ncbi:hypothetical protein DMO17_18905 [Aquipseudomonas alcaligenes]|uniref:Uracil DNA glycosylase superfamily protein n=1 Tax=Aquipseudomonas alcaligenes TaxID=43263 RepID=A0A2V4KJ39_AQUAC|nr:hypothetical protein [Pseudomonas alcaligenes]PYC19979.1 hypothetical protein DMO17_18905 [Pseudomonas alcaligenes]
MQSVDLKQRLWDAYQAVLSQEMLAKFDGCSDGLTGVFLPSAAEKPMRLMIVGMETRAWNGSFKQIHDGDLRGYIEDSMCKHQAYLDMPPARSCFGRFHQYAAAKLGCSRKEVGWGNLFAVAYKKGSPKKDSKSFAAVQELSMQLLREQLRVIQPQSIIFVTGWRYDSDLKRSLDGLIDRSEVLIKKALWEFYLGDTLCYRTSHPRHVTAAQHRDSALSKISAYLSASQGDVAC